MGEYSVSRFGPIWQWRAGGVHRAHGFSLTRKGAKAAGERSEIMRLGKMKADGERRKIRRMQRELSPSSVS